jgi:hypothetical protein
MGFFRYDDDELRARAARSIGARWPQERLLMLVPCTAERAPDQPADPRTWLGGSSEAPDGPDLRQGALAVTERRVVFFQRTREALFLRIAAAVFLTLALLGLAADHLWSSAVVGAIGAALWVVALVVEDAGLDHGHAPLGELDVDPDRQELRWSGRWTRVRRLLVPDRSAFADILRLIHRPPATSFGS